MLISDSYRKELLIPAWRFTASGVLWGLLPADDGRIVGEDRDLDRKRTKFFCLEGSTGAVVWRDRSYGESWWTGLEDVEMGVLYIHGFATPSLPLHQGIIAVDVATGAQLWEAKNLRFIRASGTRVFAEPAGGDGSVLHELDSRSGRVVGTLPRGEWTGAHSPGGVPAAGFVAPMPLEFLREASPVLQMSIERHTGSRKESLEGIYDSGFLVFSFQETPGQDRMQQGLVDSYLLVIEEATGMAVYRDCLVSGVSETSRPTFFIRDHVLHYVKDRATLLAVRLREEG